MKIIKWFCEYCGTMVIPGDDIVWDESSQCPGCWNSNMVKEEPKPKRTNRQKQEMEK